MNESSPSPPVMLEYAGRDETPLPSARTHLCFKLAMGCWLVPLISGVLTFLVWVVTRSDAVVGIGELIFVGGTVSALGGGVCALVLLCDRWGRSKRKFREAILPAAMLLFLLFSNFVVALALILAMFSIQGPFKQ